ncbi:MAG: putative baseplate assembly protein [Longimicrobiaceae bacterium]
MSTQDLDCAGECADCAACAGAPALTPTPVDNRPGLPAVSRRVGTHAAFRDAMLARLSARDLPALHGLNTRDPDDFAVALLDAWASVADVLTFYGERIANEAYLRTAVERLSVVNLARLVGYEPRPGVAASAELAFELEEAKGAPRRVRVPVGTRVQSVPVPGELPQTFETTAELEARAAWSALVPRRLRPQALTTTAASVVVRGAATRLQKGDRVLIRAGGSDKLRVVRAVETDNVAVTTRVVLTGGTDPQEPADVDLATSPARAAFTGTPELTRAAVEAQVKGASWSQPTLSAAATVLGWQADALEATLAELAARPAPPAGVQVIAFRQRAAVFGHNAPVVEPAPAFVRYGLKLARWDLLDVDNSKAVDVFPTLLSNWQIRKVLPSAQSPFVYLDSVYPGAVPGTLVALARPGTGGLRVATVLDAVEVTRTEGGITAKVTRLELTEPVPNDFTLAETTVYLEGEELAVADVPVTRPVGGAGIDAQGLPLGTRVKLDGAHLGLGPGRRVVLSGERADLPGVAGSEVLTVAEAWLDDGRTVLLFESGPLRAYRRDTVKINANVAPATHGETREEVLGGGDATRAFQRFTLRQAPLTYVSGTGPTGADSTLQVWVNGVRWKEVSDFQGRGPDERIYVTRTDESGRTVVTFGDGVTGSRLPTGQENVRALFRQGIGTGGLVAAGQISLPLTRPPGLRAVFNPLPSSGADDPEAMEAARRNAPLATLAVDRVVSLQDYEDFARAFAGIAKALATWSWTGRRREIFLTVAAPGGRPVPDGSRLSTSLREAIARAGDPSVPVRVGSFRPVPFRLEARVETEAERARAAVLADVRAALLDTFSFDRRAFGQPVALSEVIAAMQAVPGVVWVDVDVLARPGGPAQPAPVLSAALPETGGGGAVLAAELLVIDPASLRLGGTQ